MEVKVDVIDDFLCSTCLCVGRRLSTITDHRMMKYYQNTIKEIPLNMPVSAPNVCWECTALLKRCYTFAEQVKDSFRILQTYSNEILRDRLLTDVSRTPRLKSQSVNQLSIAPSIEIQVDDEPVQSVFVKDESEWGVKEEEQQISDYENLEYLETSDDASLNTIKEQTNKNKIKKTRKKRKRKLEMESEASDDIKESTEILAMDKAAGESNDVKTEKQTKSKPTKKYKKIRRNIKTVILTPEEVAAERSGALISAPYIGAELKCENCILVFKTKMLYELHLKNAHDETKGNYKCTICNSVFSTEKGLMIDYKKHTKRYDCGYCGLRMSEKKSMNAHYDEIHMGILPEYTCETCGKISNSIHSHKYHRATHRARLPCPRCDKTFRHRVGLFNHTAVVHKDQNKFPCDICGRVLKWKSSLKKHMEIHESKRNVQFGGSDAYCQLCDVSFTSICSLKRHLRSSLKHVSADYFKFICDHCNKKFTNKTKLRDHIEEKHLFKKYQCSICLKPSKNRVTLEQHTRNVHRGRPHNKMCHLCGKGFPTQLQLDSHIRSHTGEKPFICEFCPSTFSQHGNLHKHYRQVHQHTPKKISMKPAVESRAAPAPAQAPEQDATVTYLKQVVFQFNTM